MESPEKCEQPIWRLSNRSWPKAGSGMTNAGEICLKLSLDWSSVWWIPTNSQKKNSTKQNGKEEEGITKLQRIVEDSDYRGHWYRERREANPFHSHSSFYFFVSCSLLTVQTSPNTISVAVNCCTDYKSIIIQRHIFVC